MATGTTGAAGSKKMEDAATLAGVTPAKVDPVAQYHDSMTGAASAPANPYATVLDNENQHVAAKQHADSLASDQGRLSAINARLSQLQDSVNKPQPVEMGSGPMGGAVLQAPRSTESLKNEFDSLVREKNSLESNVASLSGAASSPAAAIATPERQENPMVTQGLARLHERQIYDLTHGVDPKAVQAYTQYTMNNLREAQRGVDQRLQTQADIENGLVKVDHNTGTMYTTALDSKGHISNQAGSLSYGDGKPESLYENSQGLTRSEKNPDGTITYYPAGGGKVVMGKSTTGEPATPSAFNPQSAALSALNYKDLSQVIPRPSGGTIEGVPGRQYLNQNAMRLADQGVVVPGSYNDQMQQQINAALRQPNGDVEKVLRQYDAMRNTPQFNQTIPNAQAPASASVKYINAYPQDHEASEKAVSDYNKRVDAAREALKKNGTTASTDASNPLRPGVEDDSFKAVQEEASKLPQSNFRQQVAAERELERAKGLGPSSDPVQNYQTSQALAQAALKMAQANGEDASAAYKYLPESVDKGDPHYLVDVANQILNKPNMTAAEGISAMMASTPQYAIGGNTQAEGRADKIAALQSAVDTRVQKAEDAENKQAFYESSKMTGQQRFDMNSIGRLETQITELSKNNGEVINAARLKELRDKLAVHENRLAKSMGAQVDEPSEPQVAGQEGATPVTVTSKEEYEKLPKGTPFIWTDKSGTSKSGVKP